MAASNNDSSATANGDGVPKVGPHPGFISSSNQYTSELKLRRMLKDNGCDPARQDNYRLQGVQLLDNVRKSLQLYARLSHAYHEFTTNSR
jgi:CTD kinase subunit beta